MVASKPNADCPLCHTELEGQDELREHLTTDHDKEDVVDLACGLLDEQELWVA